MHELSQAIDQWEERVRSYQVRARDRISDDVRSGILTDVFFAKIKTHIHLNLSRLPDYAAGRSEIAMFPTSAGSMGRKVRGQRIVITVGSVVTWRRTVSRWPSAKARVAIIKDLAVFTNPRQAIQRMLRSVDLVGCSFGSPCDDWNWNKCRKVTVTLDSGAAASAAPKSLETTTP